MAALTYKGSVVGASSTTGDAVGYDNTDSGLQATDVQDAIDEIVDGLGSASSKDVASSGDASASQVVLGNDTRLSDARNAADVYDWAKASTKPSYTANEVGAISSILKGAASGVAELDANGKVPSAQLPSYVDDVIEGYLYNGHFYEESTHTTEIVGETGKIYVDLTTEKTYRWSGTAFVEISESLALGETSSTAYAGDKGKANADAITAIKDGTTIDSFGDVEGAISTLQSNFQGGVDSVYDAIVARGTTPASKSLSDVVTGIGNIETIHTTTYKPTSRASNNDMGKTHYYRYVNTTEVPNSNSGTYSPTTKSTFDLGATNTYRYVNTTGVVNVNSGTYDITSNGVKDMTAENTYRYANVNVPNTNTGTYTFASGSHGSLKDMGATNDKRYVVATNVYNQGKADGKADHSTTYTPTTRASNNDMGQTHSYRYVDTNSVPNSNAATYDVTSNGVKDMGATNDKRYVNVNVPNSNFATYTPAGNSTYDMGATNNYRYCDGRTAYTAGYNAKVGELKNTYAPTSRASNLDMGSNHSYRYVNTNGVPNSNSATYTPAGNAIYDMGATNDKRYCDGRTAYSAGYSAKRAELTGTYKPTSRASNLDMGSNHTYRYVNTNSVPNSNSGTQTITANGTTDMGATNDKRYVSVSVANSNSGTYTPTTKSTFDMGATNNKRYVDTRSVANVNSGTYTPAGNAIYDMGAANDKRYCDGRTAYAAGQANPPTQTKTATPSTSSQTVSPDSGKFLSSVTVNAIPNLHTTNSMIVPRWGTDAGSKVPASQVATRNPRIDFNNTSTYGSAEMIEIAMPEGYYAWSYGNSSCCIPTETKTVTAGTSASTVTPTEYNTKGKYVKFLKSVTVNPTPSQEKTVTASRSAQTVSPDSGKLLSKVTINKYPDATGTYTASSRGSALDMGATNNLRYVNTNSVPNSNSGTYTPAGNAIYDMGSTNDKRYCDGRTAYTAGYNAKRDSLTATYTPDSRASKLDMGSNHSYRYVNTNSVPNSNSGTYGSVTSNGVKDMGATNSYRYCNINVPNSNSGTYTYASGSTGGTIDMGATNSYRYVNATNVYNKGKTDGKASVSFTQMQIKYKLGASGNIVTSTYYRAPFSGRTNGGDSYTYYVYLASGYQYLITLCINSTATSSSTITITPESSSTTVTTILGIQTDVGSASYLVSTKNESAEKYIKIYYQPGGSSTVTYNVMIHRLS